MYPVEPIVPRQGVSAGVGVCRDTCGSFTLLNKADQKRPGYCMANGATAVPGTPCLPWVQAELHDMMETIATLKHCIRLQLPQLRQVSAALQSTLSEGDDAIGDET